MGDSNRCKADLGEKASFRLLAVIRFWWSNDRCHLCRSLGFSLPEWLLRHQVRPFRRTLTRATKVRGYIQVKGNYH